MRLRGEKMKIEVAEEQEDERKGEAQEAHKGADGLR